MLAISVCLYPSPCMPTCGSTSVCLRPLAFQSLEPKIRELEFKLEHESNDDEKGMIKRIQELKAAAPAVREAAEQEAQLKAVEDARTDIQARLAHCDGHLNIIKARETAEWAVLEELQSSQAETELDIPALNVEKIEVGWCGPASCWA